MKFNEYRKYTGATMAELGSKILNSVHMVLGIATEILDELDNAVTMEDTVNISEELADANWYIANYCNIWNIDMDEALLLPVSNPALTLENLIGRLQDLDKKELAYNKEASILERKELIARIFLSIEAVANYYHINMDKARERNIAKLRSRYGDKFDAHLAQNRNLDLEREILEG